MLSSRRCCEKIISPDRKRQAVQQSIHALDVSERRACRVVGQPRSTQRYPKRPADGEGYLTARIIDLASQYGCYGYRRVTALLRNEGWIVNHKRVERIWRREGLKVPQKQPKRGGLWLNDGSIVRLKPLFPQHVWSYDFMQARIHNGVPFRILNVIDEYSRECLAARVARKLTHHDVLDVLTKILSRRGFRFISGLLMGPSSPPSEFAAGCRICRSSRCSLNRAAPGKTAILNHSMGK